MKRLIILFLLVALTVLTFAGCGSGDADSPGSDANDPNSSSAPQKGPTAQAEAASCAANRKTIEVAVEQYYFTEGSYPTTIKQLVPGCLQSIPACPSGGTYTLAGNTVTCSVHGR